MSNNDAVQPVLPQTANEPPAPVQDVAEPSAAAAESPAAAKAPAGEADAAPPLAAARPALGQPAGGAEPPPAEPGPAATHPPAAVEPPAATLPAAAADAAAPTARPAKPEPAPAAKPEPAPAGKSEPAPAGKSEPAPAGKPEPAPAAKPEPAPAPKHQATQRIDFDTAAKPGASFKPLVLRDELIGKVLQGRYEILRKLGQGGMGAVYAGRQLSVDREVAVKVMHGRGVEPTQVKRFFREAQAASALNSRHTIKVIDFGETEDQIHYMVMELLHGRPLDDELSKGPMAPERALRLARQICLSLKEAHAQGIIHRDLKPSNIFVEPSEEGTEIAKVLDFGIAKWHRAGMSHLTVAGSLYGTPRYMSPEHCQSMTLDARSDLYALGVLLYEMISGKPLFDILNPAALIMAQVTEDPTPLCELAPDCPPQVASLVHRLLAKKPEDRYSSAEELIQAIDGLGLPGSAAPGQGTGQRPAVGGTSPAAPTAVVPALPQLAAAAPSGRRWRWIAIPATLTVLLGAGVFFWGRGQLNFMPPAPASLAALLGAGEESGSAAPAGPVLVQVKRGEKPAAPPSGPGTGAAAGGGDVPAPTAPDEQPGVAAPEPDQPVPGPAGSYVNIGVRTEPRRAVAIINGMMVRETPVIFKLVQGTTPVQLMVRQNGYRDDVQMLVPDRDRDINVKLVKLEEGSASAK